MAGIPEVIRINTPVFGERHSVSSPRGGLLYTDHTEVDWGYHKKSKNAILGLIDSLDLGFDRIYIRPDPQRLREFLIIVGSIKEPLMIWRRFHDSVNTPVNQIFTQAKVFTLPQFLELSSDDLKNSISPCELRTEILLSDYRQERLNKV